MKSPSRYIGTQTLGLKNNAMQAVTANPFARDLVGEKGAAVSLSGKEKQEDQDKTLNQVQGDLEQRFSLLNPWVMLNVFQHLFKHVTLSVCEGFTYHIIKELNASVSLSRKDCHAYQRTTYSEARNDESLNLRSFLRPVLPVILSLFFCNLGFSQNYVLRSSTFSNGSEEVSSTSYNLTPTVAQSVSGETSSDNYHFSIGFLPTAIPRQAELTLQSSLNVSPGEVAPGETFNIRFSLANTGAVDVSTDISVEVYLSANATFEPDDIRLDSFFVKTDMAIGEVFDFPTGSNVKSITIPNDISDGEYRVFAVLLTGDPVDEINSDNVFFSSITIETTTGGVDDEAPLISQTYGGPFEANVSFTATITDESQITSVTLNYRPITGGDFAFVAMTNTNAQTFSVQMQDEWADEIGMEGAIIAQDEFGNTVESELFLLYREISASESIPFTPTSFNGKGATYQMFSIPYDLDNKRFDGIFATLGEYDPNVWRLFHYQNGNYAELTKGLSTSIELGKGYWFNTVDNEFTIEIGDGTVEEVTSDDPFTKNFDQGWNQIGNPYPFPITWSEIQVANPDRGLESLKIYSNGRYIDETTLQPWEGAFVFCETAGAVEFPLSARSSAGGRVAEEEISGFDWKMDMHLTLNGLHHSSTVGMHSNARLDKDYLDEIIVPRFISYLEMTTHHEAYFAPDFASDIVPPSESYEWIFTLESSESMGTATLEWDPFVPKSGSGACYLLDRSTLEVVDMRTTTKYDFSWENAKQLSIHYAEDGAFTSLQGFIGQAYPNPFRDHILVPVIVESTDQSLNVRIIDASGREVIFFNRTFENPGLHTLEWDGKDAKGQEASDGFYFLRIEMGGTEQTLRIIKK